MPKGRIQLRLSPVALDNLERRARADGVTRQDYIEQWLTSSSAGSRKPASLDSQAEQSSLSGEAKAEREVGKSQRRERKAKLAASVKDALPERMPPAGEPDTEPPKTYCPFHRPKWCEPDCPKRVAI